MSDPAAPVIRTPPSREAIAYAAAWFARPYRDEAEALLALELVIDEAMAVAADQALEDVRDE